LASDNPAQQTSFALAYLGDARYALWCRERMLQLNLGSGLTNQRVTQLVRCQTQARLLRHLLPLLTPAEQQVCRRGVNMKPLSPPRHASIRDYLQATGFECLVGYWHLNDRWNRFEALMAEDVLQEEFLRALQGGTLQQAILQR
jgi:ribonuclease-3 family protein